MKVVIVAFLALLVAGCATLDNRNDPSRLSLSDLPAGSGVMIMSAGAPKHCFSTSTFLKVMPAGIKYGGRGAALLNVDGYAVKSDFADHQGSVHAVALPAGEYYLAAWIANPYVSAVRVPKADFSIAAGEVIYLGEYFIPVACTWSPVSVFRDRKERDIPLATQKNPHLAQYDIVTRIAQFSGWALGAPE